MSLFAKYKVALVHHWLVTRRGGEHVFEALAELFPTADIFTLVRGGSDVFPFLGGRTICPSFLQRLPRASHWYRYYLPLFPAAVAQLDLTGYDLIISSDAALMKGIRANPGAIHICYCHTPMRCIWTGYETYRNAAGPATRLALGAVRSWLRRWDYEASRRVTLFVSNSQNVQNRIKECYGRESVVIYPPVDVENFSISGTNIAANDFFLLVSQLVPYKRVDLVVEAFNRSGKKLVIIGDGPDKRRLIQRAKPNVQFLGAQPRHVVVKAMQQCKAFVFAGEEDFGIVMAEAQACGKPVIAFAEGGAREIIEPGITGVLFEEQTVPSLLNAVDQLDLLRFEASQIRSSALRFGRERFLREFSGVVEETDRKSTRLNSSHYSRSRMPSSA